MRGHGPDAARSRRRSSPERPTTALTTTECLDIGEVDANATPPDDDLLAAMAKALGHPARVRILRVLDARQACVTGDVVAELGLAQSTVSEHLRILREVGLIRGEIEGPRTRYCVSTAGLATFKAGIAAL